MRPLTIDIAEFCRVVGCGKTKTYELIKQGYLTRVRIGRRTFVTMESVEALIERSTVGGGA